VITQRIDILELIDPTNIMQLEITYTNVTVYMRMQETRISTLISNKTPLGEKEKGKHNEIVPRFIPNMITMPVLCKFAL